MRPISMRNIFNSTITRYSSAIVLVFALSACDGGEPIAPERYQSVDEIAETISTNLDSLPGLELVVDIDHSRLAAKTDSRMPPARVLIFSDVELEARLLKESQLLGVDLPLRVLVYEEAPGLSKVIYNNFDYLASRYQLMEKIALREAHDKAYARALSGVGESRQRKFDSDLMQPDGLITIDSSHDFNRTISIIYQAINTQEDTIVFGEVDYQKNTTDQGVEIRPTKLILFGAPAPGAKAMQDAMTLGLDAFCQKFLVWEDAQGGVHLSYNDLLAIAERQNVQKSIALRVINYRLTRTFQSALSE